MPGREVRSLSLGPVPHVCSQTARKGTIICHVAARACLKHRRQFANDNDMATPLLRPGGRCSVPGWAPASSCITRFTWGYGA